jgi:hypothetical protein
MTNTVSTITINVQRIGYRGEEDEKRTNDATTKCKKVRMQRQRKKIRRETLCGRLDRTINYESAIKHHIQIC